MKTILQVEDDPKAVSSLKSAFKKAGVANPLQVVNDGQQAIDYLKGAGKYGDRGQYPMPCLVLLDINVPHVSGLDVLKWIRQQADLAVVVLFLTAGAEEAVIASAYRLGANGFLIKKSEAGKLEEMARAIQDYWLTQNTFPQELSPESPMEGVVSLVRTPAGAREAKGAPSQKLVHTRNRRPLSNRKHLLPA